MSYDFPHRVTYAETDRMGVVYYANYLVLFEIGRTEMIRASGRPYLDMEHAGWYLPVVEASCKYHRPARYDDLLTIRTTLRSFKGVRMEFGYEILRDGELLAEGATLHAFVDKDGKPKRPDAGLKAMLEGLAG